MMRKKKKTTDTDDVRQAEPAAPEPAAAANEDFAKVAAHLEYYGYDVGPRDARGWAYASHASRYDVAVRTLANGTRLFCKVGIGAALGNTRAAWLEYLNTANTRGYITQFSLTDSPAGGLDVRMAAFIAGRYGRKNFAMMLDYWHDDLDLVRRKPEFPVVDEAPVAEEEAVASATVN